MASHFAHLQAQDFRVMPWKNGAGTTTELLMMPPHSDLSQAFLWRISLAQLTTSGAFSKFPGYQRILVQLSGQPMRLIHNEDSSQQLSLLQAYAFAGEWETRAELPPGPAQDFNLIYDRQRISATLECITTPQQGYLQQAAMEHCFLFAWRGSCPITADSGSWTLKAGEALHIELRNSVKLQIAGEDMLMLKVTIKNLAE